jgi:hypothetical protein
MSENLHITDGNVKAKANPEARGWVIGFLSAATAGLSILNQKKPEVLNWALGNVAQSPSALTAGIGAWIIDSTFSGRFGKMRGVADRPVLSPVTAIVAGAGAAIGGCLQKFSESGLKSEALAHPAETVAVALISGIGGALLSRIGVDRPQVVVAGINTGPSAPAHH